MLRPGALKLLHRKLYTGGTVRVSTCLESTLFNPPRGTPATIERRVLLFESETMVSVCLLMVPQFTDRLGTLRP